MWGLFDIDGGAHLSDSSKSLEIPSMKIKLSSQFVFSEE